MRGDEIDPAEPAIVRGPASGQPSDQELVNRMAQGDQNALRELMLRHRGRVQRFAGRFLRDRDRIDDVVNDVFVAAWRQARAFEQRASVATWLLAIAKYRAMSAHSEQRQREEELDEKVAAKLVDHNDTPDVVVERKDRAKLLRRLTASLPKQQARLIDLVYYRDKSVREVAAIVGIPDNTAKTRMFLARKRLAVLLAAEGLGPRLA
jgi:RNA polymerase sigma-70 factor (ECF subfamily)